MQKTNLPPVHFHFTDQVFSFQERTRLKAFLVQMFKREAVKLGSLSYIFCSDEYLLEINRTYLDHNYYTDIITFDLSESRGAIQGEIYISIDRVRDNAQNLEETFKRELHRVIFHGVLHLCGYRDKTAKEEAMMRKMEDKYLMLYFEK